MEKINNKKIVEMLFKTNAFVVAPAEKPFWYTSGKIGPFYINTHFLYGNSQKAKELLVVIDRVKSEYFECPKILLKLIKENYNTDEIFKSLIDIAVKYIQDNINIDKIDYISGGERRDWFFSLIIADFLGKEHITIYKNQKNVLINKDGTKEIDDISGQNVLHIADLLNEASSYERLWIPTIKNLKGSIKSSFVIIDRKQGADKLFAKENIESHSLVDIDSNFLEEAFNLGYINQDQLNVVTNYLKDPIKSMGEFIRNNQDFMKNALNSDDLKERDRAQFCIDNKIYGNE